jgi:23S rRNA U2552 (ribose-2'-O)-methylase RlmE/FtsJ
VNEWRDSPRRRSIYRAIVKGRVEIERKLGPSNPLKRAAAAPARGNLSWLAAVYGSDKGATAHRYVDLYERHFGPLRHHVMSVLEIGVYRGASLQMWRDYFPRAEIFGIDINEMAIKGDRIHTLRGDQSDAALLAQVRELGPFDVIIDDGSHLGSHVLATFEGLYSSLQADGVYVIEDMHTSYQSDYGGGPPGQTDTSVALVQRLIDAVNRDHIAEAYPEAAAGLPAIGAMHIYPRIAFIERSRK